MGAASVVYRCPRGLYRLRDDAWKLGGDGARAGADFRRVCPANEGGRGRAARRSRRKIRCVYADDKAADSGHLLKRGSRAEDGGGHRRGSRTDLTRGGRTTVSRRGSGIRKSSRAENLWICLESVREA